MYFPIGWPKVLNIPQLDQHSIRQVVCNRDKILFAILTDDSLSIWFCKPCVPIVCHRRSQECLEDIGLNELVEWRPDSSMLVVATCGGHLLLYKLGVVADLKSLYEQVDSPHPNLRRDSAELFIKEIIPPLYLSLSERVSIEGGITSMVCIRDELMLATTRGHVLRYRWDGSQNRDYCLDLRRVPFCIDQQVSKAIPIVEANTYIVDIEYSPLVGGFAVVLNDGRAAFLTAASLRFDPNQVQGIWAQNIDDATCASVNHKYRLLVFGRKNSQCMVYCIDESTGGLEMSHQIVLSSKDYPGSPGGVRCVRWTPDGCAMAVAWQHGGLSLWSTFGALLMCTLGWDYGLHANHLHIHGMEWSAEGYQLWMVKRQPDHDPGGLETRGDCIVQLDFVKSALTVNPCMSHQGHLYLQGEDRLFVNLGNSLSKGFSERAPRDRHYPPDEVLGEPGVVASSSTLMGSKQWIVVPIPSAYSATNWPIRYTAIDAEGESLAVAGRTGLAHYSMVARKWKLFGNETQEKDFVVTGGLLWWQDHVIMGCYSIVDNRDEIRVYPRDARLDNSFVKVTRISAQALLLNTLRDSLITYCADGRISIYNLSIKENQTLGGIELTRLQNIDISALCVHPACVVSVTLTTLRTETGRHAPKEVESIMLNVSGRLLMVNREQSVRHAHEDRLENVLYTCSPPTVLASCVENVWVPRRSRREKPHLTEALWLFCGAHGMRVWLPLFPRDGDMAHTFMSKRIMLPFQLRIYPLAILFEDAILLGAENDTMLYTSDVNSPFSLPFSVLEKTSQVYLHQILRQLIRRNLGYHAWEIARSCTSLPYFPHSLELLLHEVLEEEATSKEPIPDAQLPSVIKFIQEFPVYLQTVVQCARKTEIALWPYLFSAAGKPKDLFQECLARKQLNTAASYLIILQNLEPSSVSRQYATLLLDAALDQCKWELSKDLVRFLRAIDPNDVESPRASFIMPGKYGLGAGTPPLSPNEDDLSLVLGTMQVSRGRSFSTTTTPKPAQLDSTHRESSKVQQESSKSVPMRRKKSVPTGRRDSTENCASAEEFFIDVILQRHARRLLSAHRLLDLGHFAASLDFHLVAWLGRERERVARVDDCVSVLKQLHEDFAWPYPVLQHPVSYYLQESVAGLSPSSPVVEDRTKSLAVDIANGGSRVGDSGYVSYPSGHADVRPGIHLPAHYPPSVLMPSECPSSSVMEAQLMPHLLQDDVSMMSEECSLWGDDLEHYNTSETSDSRWSEIPSSQFHDQLSQELSNRGSPKAEVQLRYLLQLFMEANCLEWALVISILLRDAMAVLRTTNSARSQDQSVESVQRLKDGLLTVCQWSNTECLGYKPFTLAIQNQIVILSKVLSSKQQLQQALLASHPTPSSPRLSRSRRASSNHESGPVGSASAPAGPSSAPGLDIPESLSSQEKTSVISRVADNAGPESNKPRAERRDTSAVESSDLTAIEEAKEQAIEDSGCSIS